MYRVMENRTVIDGHWGTGLLQWFVFCWNWKGNCNSYNVFPLMALMLHVDTVIWYMMDTCKQFVNRYLLFEFLYIVMMWLCGGNIIVYFVVCILLVVIIVSRKCWRIVIWNVIFLVFFCCNRFFCFLPLTKTDRCFNYDTYVIVVFHFIGSQK